MKWLGFAIALLIVSPASAETLWSNNGFWVFRNSDGCALSIRFASATEVRFMEDPSTGRASVLVVNPRWEELSRQQGAPLFMRVSLGGRELESPVQIVRGGAYMGFYGADYPIDLIDLLAESDDMDVRLTDFGWDHASDVEDLDTSGADEAVRQFRLCERR